MEVGGDGIGGVNIHRTLSCNWRDSEWDAISDSDSYLWMQFTQNGVADLCVLCAKCASNSNKPRHWVKNIIAKLLGTVNGYEWRRMEKRMRFWRRSRIFHITIAIALLHTLASHTITTHNRESKTNMHVCCSILPFLDSSFFCYCQPDTTTDNGICVQFALAQANTCKIRKLYK